MDCLDLERGRSGWIRRPRTRWTWSGSPWSAVQALVGVGWWRRRLQGQPEPGVGERSIVQIAEDGAEVDSVSLSELAEVGLNTLAPGVHQLMLQILGPGWGAEDHDCAGSCRDRSVEGHGSIYPVFRGSRAAGLVAVGGLAGLRR